jgi:hypothetical protein
MLYRTAVVVADQTCPSMTFTTRRTVAAHVSVVYANAGTPRVIARLGAARPPYRTIGRV